MKTICKIALGVGVVIGAKAVYDYMVAQKENRDKEIYINVNVNLSDKKINDDNTDIEDSNISYTEVEKYVKEETPETNEVTEEPEAPQNGETNEVNEETTPNTNENAEEDDIDEDKFSILSKDIITPLVERYGEEFEETLIKTCYSLSNKNTSKEVYDYYTLKLQAIVKYQKDVKNGKKLINILNSYPKLPDVNS